MNEELVKHQLDVHDKRLNNHADRLDELERGRASTDVKMDNLCDKLQAQTKSINWLIGILVSSLLGFFLYAIQNHLFK